MVQPIPEGLDGRIVPYLMIDGAAEAIEFCQRALGATENYRLEMPGGGIGHAEIVVNGAVVYLADAPDDMEGDAAHPGKLGGTTVLREPEDQFHGDRAAVIADPFGHQWSLHTHIKDVSSEEMAAAAAAMG